MAPKRPRTTAAAWRPVAGGRVLDVGCGALGWLRILSEWIGPSGQVVGTDIDEGLLDAARSFLAAEG